MVRSDYLTYLLPLLSLLIFIIDLLTINISNMIFWALFLAGMLPCGIVGLIFSIVGIVKSYGEKKIMKNLIGSLGILLGFASIAGGVLGLMVIYAVVGD